MNKALKMIYDDLNAGYIYGQEHYWDYYNNKPYDYPYFEESLYKTYYGFIGWQHYGSSANKNTLNDLNWIITTIFKTTPEEFLISHIRNDHSDIYRSY